MKSDRPKPLHEWFAVKFNEEEVLISADPPGRKPWSQSFKWCDVVRICYKAEGPELSDGIYFFTSKRPESYVVPVEAAGGAELWSEVLHRGLFSAELAIRAMATHEGLFCWPADEGTS